MKRVRIVSIVVFVLGASLSVRSQTPEPAAGAPNGATLKTTESRAPAWLSDEERSFFLAFRVEARFGKSSYVRKYDAAALERAARGVSVVLLPDYLACVEALDRAWNPSAESIEVSLLFQRALPRAGQAVGTAALGQFLGENPYESALRATNMIMDGGQITRAWDLQATDITQRIVARSEALSHLGAILDDVAARGPARETGMHAKIVGIDDQVFLRLDQSGEGFRESLVLVIVRPRPVGNSWVFMNQLAGIAAHGMGVRSMNAHGQSAGMRLAAAQTRAASEPRFEMALLPARSSGRTGNLWIPMSRRAVQAIERVELRWLTSKGCLHVEEVEGLSALSPPARPGTLFPPWVRRTEKKPTSGRTTKKNVTARGTPHQVRPKRTSPSEATPSRPKPREAPPEQAGVSLPSWLPLGTQGNGLLSLGDEPEHVGWSVESTAVGPVLDLRLKERKATVRYRIVEPEDSDKRTLRVVGGTVPFKGRGKVPNLGATLELRVVRALDRVARLVIDFEVENTPARLCLELPAPSER